MALLKNGSEAREWQNYRLDDYEEQKKAYLRGAAEEADSILKSARQKAGDILREAHSKGVEQAKAEADRLKAESESKGYQDGLEKGRQEALELEKKRYDDEIGGIVQSIGNVAEAFQREADELVKDAESSLVSSAMDLAHQVIEVESSFNGEILDVRLKKALQFLRLGMKLTIHLPVGAKEKLEPLLNQHLKLEGRDMEVEWIEDSDLINGNLVVKSGDSIAQFDSQVQWRLLLDKLKHKLEEA
jgi:flagellar biosynthesis/type III secretory pathway protein FliH